MQTHREHLKKIYGDLFDKTAAILFRYDPISINVGDNQDEYEPEVGTILPRLETATSSDEALDIIHEEFVQWFNVDEAKIAGAKDKYKDAATEIWAAWQTYKTAIKQE